MGNTSPFVTLTNVEYYTQNQEDELSKHTELVLCSLGTDCAEVTTDLSAVTSGEIPDDDMYNIGRVAGEVFVTLFPGMSSARVTGYGNKASIDIIVNVAEGTVYACPVCGNTDLACSVESHEAKVNGVSGDIVTPEDTLREITEMSCGICQYVDNGPQDFSVRLWMPQVTK